MIWCFMVSQSSFSGALFHTQTSAVTLKPHAMLIYNTVSDEQQTSLSWLHPLGRPPSDEPFCEQEEQDDFLGVGCHMFTV